MPFPQYTKLAALLEENVLDAYDITVRFIIGITVRFIVGSIFIVGGFIYLGWAKKNSSNIRAKYLQQMESYQGPGLWRRMMRWNYRYAADNGPARTRMSAIMIVVMGLIIIIATLRDLIIHLL